MAPVTKVTAPALAPETLAGVQAAREALEQHAARLMVTGDPLAAAVSASAAGTAATMQLIVDASLTFRASADAMQANAGIRPEHLRQAVAQGLAEWGQIAVRRLAWRTAAWAGVVLAGVFLAGGVGGFLFHGAVPGLVQAGAEQCQAQRDGGQLCWIPVWGKLPPR